MNIQRTLGDKGSEKHTACVATMHAGTANGKQPLTNCTIGESFGEISFVNGSSASASVVADGEVEMFIIEGYFMNILFDMRMFFLFLFGCPSAADGVTGHHFDAYPTNTAVM